MLEWFLTTKKSTKRQTSSFAAYGKCHNHPTNIKSLVSSLVIKLCCLNQFKHRLSTTCSYYRFGNQKLVKKNVSFSLFSSASSCYSFWSQMSCAVEEKRLEGKKFNYVTHSLVVPQGVTGIQKSTVIPRELLWAQQSPDTEDLPLPLLQHPLLAASLLVPIQYTEKSTFLRISFLRSLLC